MGSSTSWPVTLVHTPLTSQSGLPNPFAHLVANHMAVDVGHPGDITRFELEVQSDRKTVKLCMTRDAKPGLYQTADMLLYDSGIKGETSLSDEEIEEIAQELIKEHGDYDLILNNCQVWASHLFSRITDVEGHLAFELSALALEISKAIIVGEQVSP